MGIVPPDFENRLDSRRELWRPLRFDRYETGADMIICCGTPEAERRYGALM